MIRFPFFIPILLITVIIPTAVGRADNEKTPAGDASRAKIVVEMEKCKARRPGKITSGLASLFFGPPKDKLVRKGEIVVDGETFTLYLPKASGYTVDNTGSDNSHHRNTSTRVSIDQNGDGKLSDDESWFANLPVRIGDRMFQIAHIAKDGSRVEIRPTDDELCGVVIGRRCPPFSFQTQDGRTVKLDDYKGKTLLLDIWSFT